MWGDYKPVDVEMLVDVEMAVDVEMPVDVEIGDDNTRICI